jgi:hypothetical protein
MPEFRRSIPQLIARVADALLLASRRRQHCRQQGACDQSHDTDEPRVAIHPFCDLIPGAPGHITGIAGVIAGAIQGGDADFANRPNGSPRSARRLVYPTIVTVTHGPRQRFAVKSENLPHGRRVIVRRRTTADPDIVRSFADPASRRLHALVLREAIRQSGVIRCQPSETNADQRER